MEFWCSFALRQQTFCEKGDGIGILSVNHRHRAFAASNIEQAQYLMIIDFQIIVGHVKLKRAIAFIDKAWQLVVQHIFGRVANNEVKGVVNRGFTVGTFTVISGRFTLKTLKAVALDTSKITAIMVFILMAAQVFALSFRGLHGEYVISKMFEALPGGVNGDIWFMMLLIFVLGFFIEWIEISYIAVPLFLPILISQGVDPVWLAMLITVNLQSSFLTPPFGWALFYLKGVAPPEVTIKDIYKGVVPFVIMQGITLALVFFYPQIALWLPKAIGW
jgi:TRAP-type mannitol/chloroaromatic compound transport system permease large subunit